MSIVGLIVVALLFAGSVYALIHPFVSKTQIITEAQRSQDELLTAYERVLATIRDLDEDYAIGKMPEAAYQRERAFWAERGVEMLKVLAPDPATAQQVLASTAERRNSRDERPPAIDTSLDDAVEQAIRAYRQASTP